jgi:redox-sensitive bicupin YhaK (pirin superfamily)
MGFETHPHRDMEIISFIISGQLEHKDSMGHSRVIGPGEIQVMSAGKGVLHSEFNPSRTQKTHSLQIWVQPNKIGVEPNYDQFTYKEPSEGVVLLADSVGAEQVAKINQDMKLSLGVFEKSAHELSFNAQKHYWIQVIEGEANILDDTFKAGDALGIKEESLLSIIPLKKFKFLLFELP